MNVARTLTIFNTLNKNKVIVKSKKKYEGQTVNKTIKMHITLIKSLLLVVNITSIECGNIFLDYKDACQ